MPLSKKLIINADDFGIHESVNKGIFTGHFSGCITSASIMPTGQEFNQAIEIAGNCPNLGLGVHLTLVGERPVEPIVSSLTDNYGNFNDKYPEFIKRYVLRKIQLKDIYRELRAQIKKVILNTNGLNLTHIDSHQHLHILPGIIDIVIALALEFNIKAVRIPSEPFWFCGGFRPGLGRFIGRTGLTALALVARRKVRKAGILSPGHFFGMLAGGNLREEFLLNIIDRLPPGVSEIMLHPGQSDLALNDKYGWNYNWQAELQAATSPKVIQKIKEMNVELINFGKIG